MQYGRSSSALLTCRYILKSILYDPAMRTDMLILPCSPDRLDTFLSGVNISSSRPFMLQQLMHGPEFSCYALAHKGRLVAHSDTAACISNLNFKHLGRPEIQDFTARLCSALKLDGQVRLLPGLRLRQIAASGGSGRQRTIQWLSSCNQSPPHIQLCCISCCPIRANAI